MSKEILFDTAIIGCGPAGNKLAYNLGIKGVRVSRANAPPNHIEPHLDYSDSQLPPPARHRSRPGEAGGSYDYLYVDEHYPEVSCG